VGSAGVGKTTTIAKMAARLQHEEGLRVGLISLDREKIGGIEQLEIFAAILQIPLEIPQTVKDLKKVLKRLAACDVVLVDTPAIGARKDQRPSVFDEHLHQIADLETWLVVGADTQVANMQLTTALGSDLKPSAVIVTKADLNPGLAQVTQYLSATAVPVVGLANGPNVPRDLTDASYDLFARALIQNGGGNSDRMPGTASVESPSAPVGQYLANRSSDIFHRPQCKWIRLINKDNIVMFGSFAEALNNRFKPCRYCNPQHMSITGILSQERAAR
jgi:flagellar biosynthesis protein FlhF